MLIEVFYLLVNAQQDRVGVVAFLQQDDAFNRIGIVDNRAVGPVCGTTYLAETNLGALRDGGDVLDFDSRAVLGFDDGVLDVLNC